MRLRFDESLKYGRITEINDARPIFPTFMVGPIAATLLLVFIVLTSLRLDRKKNDLRHIWIAALEVSAVLACYSKMQSLCHPYKPHNKGNLRILHRLIKAYAL